MCVGSTWINIFKVPENLAIHGMNKKTTTKKLLSCSSSQKSQTFKKLCPHVLREVCFLGFFASQIWMFPSTVFP